MPNGLGHLLLFASLLLAAILIITEAIGAG